MNTLTSALLIGSGATALMDLWGFARRPLLGIAAPDYGLVGRWVGHLALGRFRHAAITKSAPVSGELALGWVTHYLTGMIYAALLVAIGGDAWLQRPTFGPAMLVGIGTVAVPMLVIQPAMGAGFAARRTAHPGQARVQSLIMHTVFGIGLYAAGWGLRLLQFG